MDTTCLDDCGDGYYVESGDNICIACDLTCKNCVGDTRYDCTECELTRIMENGNYCRACSEYYGYEDDPNYEEGT